jgi:glucosylceramidase
VRIASNNFVSYAYRYIGADIASLGLDDVAFRNPGGGEALVTFNGAAAPIKFSLQQGRWSLPYTLPAGAMATFTWRSAAGGT